MNVFFPRCSAVALGPVFSKCAADLLSTFLEPSFKRFSSCKSERAWPRVWRRLYSFVLGTMKGSMDNLFITNASGCRKLEPCTSKSVWLFFYVLCSKLPRVQGLT